MRAASKPCARWSSRRRAAAGPRLGQENPYRPDPFRMFAAYPTDSLRPDDLVEPARPFVEGEAAFLMELPGVRNTAARLPSIPEAEAMIESVTGRPQTVGAILAAFPPERRPFVERGLLWLAKFGFLRLSGKSTRT